MWRRGWDSNPRYGVTVHLISNQAHSTTLAPLHNFALFLPRPDKSNQARDHSDTSPAVGAEIVVSQTTIVKYAVAAA